MIRVLTNEFGLTDCQNVYGCLYYIDNMSLQQIADQQGKSYAFVEHQKNAIKKKMGIKYARKNDVQWILYLKHKVPIPKDVLGPKPAYFEPHPPKGEAIV